MILLDFIDANTDPSNPAQVHVREWARRARELIARGDALLLKAKALFDADDFDAMHKVLAEHGDTLTELTQVCHKLGGEVSRLRPSTETMQ